MIVQEALNIGAEAIGHHESRLLLSHITGLTLSEMIIKNTQPLEDKSVGAFFAAIERRKSHEPLQYILGKWDFMGLTFKIDKRALIPRPETELLVEEALIYIRKLKRPAKVLDICTGSGCIAVAISRLLPEAAVTAIDISPAALALAKENAAIHGCNITFIESNLLDNLPYQTFDVIISNPPYIPTQDLETLQPELSHEPKLALDGGIDGLDIYHVLVPQCYDFLVPGGVLLLELGPPGVETIMERACYDTIQQIKDYAGHNRILTGRK